MRTRTAAAVLAVAAVIPPAAPAGATPRAAGTDSLTWSVSPSGPKGPNGRPALDYKLDPGATVTDHVAVTNHSQRPLALRLYASDAFTTAGGGFDLLAGKTRPTGAGSWFTLARTTVTLAASSRVVVPFTVAVPANATPGDHAAGVVASLAGNGTDAEGNRVTVDHRVGTRVYLRVTGALRPELSITGVRLDAATSWNPFRLPRITATFTVANTGNVRLTGKPSARVRGLFGLTGGDGGGPPVPEILPGGSLRTSVRIDDVLPLVREQVTLSVLPAPADGRPLDPAPVAAESRHAIWLVPWPQLILLALAALLVTGWRQQRRRQRRRMEAALAAALAAAEQRGREQGRAPSVSTQEGTK